MSFTRKMKRLAKEHNIVDEAAQRLFKQVSAASEDAWLLTSFEHLDSGQTVSIRRQIHRIQNESHLAAILESTSKHFILGLRERDLIDGDDGDLIVIAIRHESCIVEDEHIQEVWDSIDDDVGAGWIDIDYDVAQPIGMFN